MTSGAMTTQSPKFFSYIPRARESRRRCFELTAMGFSSVRSITPVGILGRRHNCREGNVPCSPDSHLLVPLSELQVIDTGHVMVLRHRHQDVVVVENAIVAEVISPHSARDGCITVTSPRPRRQSPALYIAIGQVFVRAYRPRRIALCKALSTHSAPSGSDPHHLNVFQH